MSVSKGKRNKRKGSHNKPLVTNPFEAAKRKRTRFALNSDGIEIENNGYSGASYSGCSTNDSNDDAFSDLMPPPPPKKYLTKPSLQAQSSALCALSFGSDDDNDTVILDEMDSSHSWLATRADGEGTFTQMTQLTQSAFLTPLDQETHQTSLSQFDVVNNRILNHTKSKIQADSANNNNNNHSNGSALRNGKDVFDDRKMEQDDCENTVFARTLQIPKQNMFLDENERFSQNSFKKVRGLVANVRYYKQYSEMEMIGKGSFGKVFKCRNRADGCFYAIKKVRTSNSHTQMNALQKEGLILSALQRYGDVFTAHIIRYHDMWIQSDYFYLVTEYCDNGNLTNFYKRNALKMQNESVLFTMILHISNALLYLHDKSFVHFDVKPDNILVTKTCKFKLADFGLATKIDIECHNTHSNSHLHSNEGDSRYLCRELIEGTYHTLELDKVDIFALGTSVYEILIDQDLPKNGLQWQRLRNGHLSFESNKNSQRRISNNMSQLITAMMQSNPSERPSAKQLVDFLRKFDDPLIRQKEEKIAELNRQLRMAMRQLHNK